MMLVCTHRSAAIMRDGFRDGYFLFGSDLETGETVELRGVFVSADWPLDENEGADGDVVLEVTVADELFAAYEFVEEGKMYRESMIPAADLNVYPRRILSETEINELVAARWRSFGAPDL